jgi:mono/diheme cytochrome c family protein
MTPPFPKVAKILTPLLGAALLAACTGGNLTMPNSVQRGKTIFMNECSQCHGRNGDGGGAASLGLGGPPPDLTGLTARNDGAFPRAFIQRFVLGTLEKENPDAAMPEFGTVGLEHFYPDSGRGAGPQVTAADMTALLDYLETIQR